MITIESYVRELYLRLFRDISILYSDGTIYIMDTDPISEPDTLPLLGSGLTGLAGIRRRKRNR